MYSKRTKKLLRNKNNKKKLKAICVLHYNENNINGIIKFTQNNNRLKIEYEINNLKDGYHGFHIHNYGDLTDGCKSACSHFNPFYSNHGSNNSRERHLGDLGNIKSLNKKAKGVIHNNSLSLDPRKINSIIGRAVIVHEDKDDLGRGKNDESLKTGNAGKRLACGVIGLSNFKC